ncbi:hypothetical protein MAMC_01929 [Methylacidimicrobium cyclopophantes]|uniref:Uncharacterized protein n=1 Tax=Methylacidimicrobium cyclopophantes TaxID=1041766 RepID=A0A5E6MQM5_9BACT|nr:hypothetical protein MAMC_01929 [Methylacidimicrobium cyclopophantes]
MNGTGRQAFLTIRIEGPKVKAGQMRLDER